jgi:hypothetical protein
MLLSACGTKEPKVTKPETTISTINAPIVTTTVGETTVTTTETTTTTTITTTETPKTSEKTNYKIGETWTVDGQWKLTITSVQLTEYRNPFFEKEPAAVYVVNCEYENIGYTDSEGIMNGLFFNLDEYVIDREGYVGYSYPGELVDYPQETPVGAKCKAQYCIGVDNAGDFIINVEQYDGEKIKQSASFEISTKNISTITIAVVETEPEETQPETTNPDTTMPPETAPTETMPPETSPPETGTDMPDATPTEIEPDPALEYDDSRDY